MKNNREDRLIEIAFGERDLNAECEIQSGRDAEQLRQYETLKSTLRLAKEVPNHQLSNERLRHAILGKGLSQTGEKVGSDLGWLWSSLAVCGMVASCVFVFSRNRMVVIPPPQAQQVDQTASTDLHFGSPVALIKPSPLHAATHLVQSRSVEGYRVSEWSPPLTHKSRRRARVSPRNEVDPSWMAVNFESRIDPSASEIDGEQPQPALTQAVLKQPAPTKSDSSDSMVVIEQSQDNDTGARAAREIASKNVLVGG